MRNLDGMGVDQRWNCANVDRGHRCANLGVFSYSTVGSTDWFCAQHFKPVAELVGPRKPRPQSFDAVAERLAIQNEAPF